MSLAPLQIIRRKKENAFLFRKMLPEEIHSLQEIVLAHWPPVSILNYDNTHVCSPGMNTNDSDTAQGYAILAKSRIMSVAN